MPLLAISNKRGRWYELADKITTRIQFEIGQIDQLFETYHDLLEKSQRESPNLVEITAIASVLHSFYNGVENIFLVVAKGIDNNVPAGQQWHRDLLKQMAEATSHRKAILTTELTNQLADYLGFRHFYRHSYSFHLDWTELEKLVNPLLDVWQQTKREFELFLESFDESTA